MKILVVDDDDAIRNLVVVTLENFFKKVEIVESSSGSDAIRIIKEHPFFTLVVSDYDMPNGTGGDLYNFIRKEGLKTPFILSTSQDKDDLLDMKFFDTDGHKNYYLRKPVGKGKWKEVIGDVFDPSFLKGENEEEYKQIRIAYFLRFNKVLCDVFIKLSDDKYLKVFNQNDIYNKQDIKKYSEKHIKHLYIKDADFDLFCDKYSKTGFLIDTPALAQSEKEDAVLNTIEVVHDLVKTVGVTPTIITLVDKCVDEIQSMTDKKENIYSLLQRVGNRKDYLCDHSFLVSYIAVQMCREMKLTTEHLVKEKMVYAAFLHDSLLDDAGLAMALDLDWEKKKEDYDKAVIEVYKKHPHEIANIARRSHKIPTNVDGILENHHELPDKKGFPRGLAANNVSPLEAIFIVAHSAINELYKIDFELSKDAVSKILSNFDLKFNKGSYKGAYEGLKNIFHSLSI